MDVPESERRTRRIPLPRRWWTRFAVSAVVLAAIAVPAAWASHQFADVPNTNPHHDDISAIALGGITTGCAPGLYCPGDPVTRQQMASFLRRGLGRVAFKFLPAVSVPGSISQPAGWSQTIIVGLPPGSVAGAAGFIKVDGEISVCNNTASGIGVRARVFVDGVAIGSDNTYLDLPGSGGPNCGNLAMNGVARVTTAGVHTASFRIGGGASASNLTNGHLTATYFPFGSTGANVFGGTESPTSETIDLSK